MLDLPASYYIAVTLCCCLLAFGVTQINTPWGAPFTAVIGTISIWYLVEPIYLSEEFTYFDPTHFELAFSSVIIFILAFVFFMPHLVRALRPRGRHGNIYSSSISGEKALRVLAVIWLMLLVYGVARMNGNLFGALFPLQGRTGANMWSRAAGADAGADGFIVSTASYIYVLALASFGVLYNFVREPRTRNLAIALIMVGWPYAFLQGSRNIALAVVLPGVLAFLLFGRIPVWLRLFSMNTPPLLLKTLAAGGVFMAVELAFRLMLAFRNIGMTDARVADVTETKHIGLNMASELTYCIQFVENGTISLSYGTRYLAELANIIPRAIWPDKPLIGIDYSLARGYGTEGVDIGVFATISSGLIGQGVLSFGVWFGPIAAAFLMGLWVALLARFHVQGTPLRLCLYLVGLGLTFNLGRDLTLLVVWPLVFGILGVKLIETVEARRLLVLDRRAKHRGRRSG
jgi:hypothetical protein